MKRWAAIGLLLSVAVVGCLDDIGGISDTGSGGAPGSGGGLETGGGGGTAAGGGGNTGGGTGTGGGAPGIDAGSDAGTDAGVPDAGPAWTAVGIGSFVTPGTVTYADDLITVAMHAGDIWYDLDDFFYVYQQRSGDLDIRAQVVSMDAGWQWAKAGVMMRQGLTRDSSNAFVFLAYANGHGFQVRDGGAAFTGPGIPNSNLSRPPYWVRLVRQGGMVRAYHSEDGGSFTEFDVFPDPLIDPVYVGLAVSSGVFDAGNITQFRQVTIRAP